jgi:hypothetical protein
MNLKIKELWEKGFVRVWKRKDCFGGRGDDRERGQSVVGSESPSDDALRRVDRSGASRFGPGQERPWGRVARGLLRSKVIVSEWQIFGVEWLLGAANGDEPERTTHARHACA